MCCSESRPPRLLLAAWALLGLASLLAPRVPAQGQGDEVSTAFRALNRKLACAQDDRVNPLLP